MMPEARLSTVGCFEDIQDRTYSFLKKAGVPVYTVKLCGDFLADPKWGSGIRRGSVVEAQLDILLTPEQLQTMDTAQIAAAVEQRLSYDELAWLRERPKQRYRTRRLAEGLENILTVCPVCGGKYTITTKKREIFCENCGKLTQMDDRYSFPEDFRFRDFAQWYHWQKEQLHQQILEDPDYVLQSKVTLRLPSLDGKTLTREAGSGVCRLSRQGLTYEGTRDGQPCTISFPTERVYRLLFGAGEDFEIYDGTEILYFVPEEKRSAVDWYLASMLIYDDTVKGGAYGTK
jgi:1-acyl-sn-glycerol-3-phosphate acyltransferase